ncbi:MAG: peptidase MA family metallohydrolase, partial [Chloroflexota bacterium]
MPKLRRLALGSVAALAAVLWATGVVAAADPAFGTPDAVSKYGESITFTQPATIPSTPKRVEILLDFPGGAGPVATEVDNATRSGEVTLRYEVALDQGHILPNTTISARWRVTAADGSTSIGPSVRVTYDDTRFKWRTKTGALVRVHWYEGSDAFGDRALAIGEKAVKDTARLLGVTETEPIDFFVYADQQAFYDALGPATRENVGGQANAEIRTLFALITPDEIDADWVGIVIPHELTHLVFNTAVDNAYHFPPRWLNEGLAVYLSQGYGSDDRGAVTDAAADGTLMPLKSIGGQFPTTRDRFGLAYA